MTAPLYDAHCHLADAKLSPFDREVKASLKAINCELSVVNGTSPEDWHTVSSYAQANPRVLAAIGLHPWKVNSAPNTWQADFLKSLENGVNLIGEIGLDQWVDGHDIEAQQHAFRWQLAEAAKRNLPVSIHCLKAIEPLMQTLRNCKVPERGIHLHALNVSVEAASELIEMGSYFSFNAGQLKPKAKHIYNLIEAIPAERILIETDAPDFLPIAEQRAFTLPDPALNHPANLKIAYEMIAQIRQLSFDALAILVEKNFKRYFLS